MSRSKSSQRRFNQGSQRAADHRYQKELAEESRWHKKIAVEVDGRLNRETHAPTFQSRLKARLYAKSMAKLE